MVIAICDDEQFFRDHLRTMIFQYKAKHRLHIDVYCYTNGTALLNSQKSFDMVFLDYQMPGIDGMTVARELRKRNHVCNIVFITAFPHFVLESFEVQPYRFLVKPITEDQITSLLNTFISEQKKLAPIIVINNLTQMVVPVKDILYLEGNGKYCIIRTTKQVYNSSKTLSQVHTLLPQHCFYRSHKSFVVNFYCIQSYDGYTATLTNGECIQIGRSKIADFKRAYKEFVKDFCFSI